MNIARQSIKIVECTISREQNVSKTLISLARLLRVKYGRFWLLSGRREIEAEIRELPENTGDLATLAYGGFAAEHRASAARSGADVSSLGRTSQYYWRH